MLLRPIGITSLDIYRDGGSVSVTFFTEDKDREYSLLFPIKDQPDDPKAKWRTYRDPVLEVYVNGTYCSPITGVSSPTVKKETTLFSWSDARALLRDLEKLIPAVKSEYLWVFGCMVEISKNDGAYNGT